MLAPAFLAIQLKGFSAWEPRTQAIVSLVGGVIFLVMATAFVRRVGWMAIVLPIALVLGLYWINSSAGCMETAIEPEEKGNFEAKGGIKSVVKPKAPAPGSPATTPSSR